MLMEWHAAGGCEVSEGLLCGFFSRGRDALLPPSLWSAERFKALAGIVLIDSAARTVRGH